MVLIINDKFIHIRECIRDHLIEAQMTNKMNVQFLNIWYKAVNGRTSSLLSFIPDLNGGDYENEKET